MDWLIKGIIAIGAALLADTVTKEMTGKHIHEHVFSWWNKLRDHLLSWAHNHQHLGAVRFIGSIDNVVSGMANLTVKAQTTRQQTFHVTIERVSNEELCELIPAYRAHRETDMTPLVMEA